MCEKSLKRLNMKEGAAQSKRGQEEKLNASEWGRGKETDREWSDRGRMSYGKGEIEAGRRGKGFSFYWTNQSLWVPSPPRVLLHKSCLSNIG